VDRSVRHGPNRLQNYLQIHETVMGQLLYTGLVDEDGLDFLPGADGRFYFAGEVLLRDRRLKLTVVKALEVVEATDPANPLVQTLSYSYNVSICGLGNVFRYCAPHDDDAMEHHLQHHRHAYDPFGPEPHRYTVRLITDGDWPKMDEVIREADAWYWENLESLESLLRAKGLA
jgi:hypothetical protein